MDDLPQRRAHGDFGEARVADLPGEGEHLGPAALVRPDPVEPLRPVLDDDRDVRERLDVVDDRRLAPEPLLRRIRRPDPGLAALALDRMDQRGLLPADEGAGAHADLEVEVEAGAEDPLPQQARGAALFDRLDEPLDGHRVLRADVEEPAVGPDGEAGDRNAFDDAEGIAFEHVPVHERARIALVGVADHVPDRILRLGGHGPLPARREAGAAAPAQPGFRDLPDDPCRLVPFEDLRERLEPVVSEVLVKALGIDDPAVAQRHAALSVEERHVPVQVEEALAERLVGHAQMLDDLPSDHLALDELFQVLVLGDAVQRVRRPDEHVGDLAEVLRPAQAEAVGGADLHARLGDAGGPQHLAELLGAATAEFEPAPLPAAEEVLVLARRVRGAVEDLLHHGPAAEDVRGEDPVDGLAVHPLVFHRHLPGQEHPDDGLATATPGATGLAYRDVLATGGCDVLAELFEHLPGAGGVLAGRRPDLDPDRGGVLSSSQGILGGGLAFGETLGNDVRHGRPSSKPTDS